jgi:hypothetical protein
MSNAFSNDPEAFIKKAKTLVSDEYNHRYLVSSVHPETTKDDFYVTWFAKTLGNWKAMVSTDIVDGHYWEVTYNGAKKEAYVDTYVKQFNRAIPDMAPGGVWNV